MATKMEKLKELAELKSAGALTEEEFNAEKAKVLAAVDDAPVQGQAVVAPQGVQLMAHQPAVMQATPQQPAVMPSINIVNTNTNTNTNVNNNKYGYRPCIPCCIGCQVCCFSCFLDSCCCCPCSCCGNAAPRGHALHAPRPLSSYDTPWHPYTLYPIPDRQAHAIEWR